MASQFPRLSSNEIFSWQECHDGGEVGAGKHLLDLLVMRGDLGVFIMASWKRFFPLSDGNNKFLEKKPVNQQPLAIDLHTPTKFTKLIEDFMKPLRLLNLAIFSHGI